MAYKNKEEQRKFQREWVKKRRETWFEKNGPCSNCGSKDNLEIHHVDKTKKVAHKIFSWSEEKFQEEISKCVILCRKCHKLAHFPIVHGTVTNYDKRGCRCDLCKKAKSEKRKEYTSRHSSTGRARDL